MMQGWRFIYLPLLVLINELPSLRVKLLKKPYECSFVALNLKVFLGKSAALKLINEEEGYLLPTIAQKITCRRFD